MRKEVDFVDLERKLLPITIFRLLDFINDLHAVLVFFFVDAIKYFVVRANLNKLVVLFLWLFNKHFLFFLWRLYLAIQKITFDVEYVLQVHKILWKILKFETLNIFKWFLNLKLLIMQNLFWSHHMTSR